MELLGTTCMKYDKNMKWPTCEERRRQIKMRGLEDLPNSMAWTNSHVHFSATSMRESNL